MNHKIHFFLIVALMAGLTFSCKRGESTSVAQAVETTSPASGETKAPAVTFEKTEYDFGKIFSGEKVTYSFSFTNTGDGPLIIVNTRSGCGCTVGDYPREPIPPGGEARIKVSFNSAGRKGFQSESVRVVTNAQPQEYLLRITAEVLQN
ncbi:MAG: DUF1573 domain-containing protein [Bacteroides sp.]|jgi:hypothetical protein|nr:DUF1573 domain-containing protein [Bacteroides sp.]